MKRLFDVVLDLVKSAFKLVPRPLTATMTVTAMPEAIRAYSMAVAPLLQPINRAIAFMPLTPCAIIVTGAVIPRLFSFIFDRR